MVTKQSTSNLPAAEFMLVPNRGHDWAVLTPSPFVAKSQDTRVEVIEYEGPPSEKVFDLTISTSWYKDAAREINKTRNLTVGWDGFDAEPPNSIARGAATMFLESLNTKPSRIKPSVVGGIGITISGRTRRQCYAEFKNSGAVYALFSDDDPEPAVKRASLSDLKTLASDIDAYLLVS